MGIHQNLMLPVTVSEMVKARDIAVAHLEEHCRHAKECKLILDILGDHIFPNDIKSRTPINKRIADIDKRLWRKSFGLVGFFDVMDAQAKDEFEEGLEESTPPFSLEYIQETHIKSIWFSGFQGHQ